MTLKIEIQRLFDWITLISISQEEMDALPPNRLGIGEQSVIAYAKIHANCVVGLDDRQARVLVEQLSLKVVGVIGILLKAKRAGLLPYVLFWRLLKFMAFAWPKNCTWKQCDWLEKKMSKRHIIFYPYR